MTLGEGLGTRTGLNIRLHYIIKVYSSIDMDYMSIFYCVSSYMHALEIA